MKNETYHMVEKKLVIVDDIIKEDDLISFNISCNSDRKILKGVVKYQDQLGFIVFVDGVKYELRKLLNIKKL